MDFEYELSEKSCLDFLKSNIPKTKDFKKLKFSHSMTFVLLLILSYIILNNWFVRLFFTIVIFIMLKNVNNMILRSFSKRSNNSLGVLLPILFNKIHLNINNNVITIKSSYEIVSIPFDKITGIYIVSNFIFITNSIYKDILIPLTIFDSEKNKNNFISNFKNFSINKSFPKNYKFI